METEVMELVKELGFKIVSTRSIYDVEGEFILAYRGNWRIRTKVTGANLRVTIGSGLYSEDETIFYFTEGEEPDLRFRKYTPEMFEIARRFGEVMGFEI